MPICAAIDIGSNAMRLKIANCVDEGRIETLCEERVPVRLGTGAFGDKGEIDEQTAEQTVDTLTHFGRLIRSHDVERLRAVATSALREATNAAAVIEAVLHATGIEIEVISGSEEARLIQLGAQLENPLGTASTYFIDIGGGSAEVSVGTAHDLLALHSFRLGAVRLAQMFVSNDPVSDSDFVRMRDFIHEEIEESISVVRRFHESTSYAIGTGGTVNALIEASCSLVSARRRSREGHAPEEASLREIEDLVRTLRRQTLTERARLPGVTAGRADIIFPGALVMRELMRSLTIEHLRPSDRGLRDGVLVDLLERVGGTPLSHVLHARRQGYIRHFARRFGVRLPHAEQVCALALSIYDQLAHRHRLGREEREVLEAAAMLHEVGMVISYSGFHKHSQYIINNAELIGFTRNEIRMIATIARYHRKSEPKDRHEAYAGFPAHQRTVIDWLVAVLRLADGLDRQHENRVTGVILSDEEDRLVVRMAATDDVSLELWTASRKGSYLQRLLGTPIVFECDISATDDAEDDSPAEALAAE